MDKILGKLIDAFGVSGNEQAVRNIVKEEIKDVDCSIREDKMGNLIVKLGEGGSKIMLCAHMDQIGLIILYIEESGIIRVGAVGDFKPESFQNTFVRFKNGTLGKFYVNKDEMLVDVGIKGRDKVLEMVKEGDTACFVGPYLKIGDNNLIGPNLDNSVGCAVLIKLIKEAKISQKEVYFVFSTQEELGGRGARAAAYALNPDYCIVVDVDQAGDVPGFEGNIKLGVGPVVKVMDKTLIMHHQVREMLDTAAKEADIKVQYSVSSGNSEGGTIHKERGGIKAGEIAIPCRYKHSTSEMICLKDAEDTVEILRKLVEH